MFFLSLLFFSCSSDNDELIKEVAVKVNFTQNWDAVTIEKSDLNNTQFTNKSGTKLTINNLRYLISKITLTDGAGISTIYDGYQLIDLNNKESLTTDLFSKITEGTYNLSITFGFNNDDNINIYSDLTTLPWDTNRNSYHFMQLDGEFFNEENTWEDYKFHTTNYIDTNITDNKGTFFTVDLGSINIKDNATIEIRMNVSQWFKTPNDWNLNELNSMLTENLDAQKKMSENGRNGVFSLGKISQ